MPFFEQSQNSTINGGNFYDITNYAPDSRKGIKLLLKYSLPQAIHNSNARDPPKCHPGTREEYIRNITSWGSGEWRTHQTRALWMRGPAGVGKSTIAQSCVEDIEASGRLGATFFFYRFNGWNDPDKFIPTIAYQLTTRYLAYRDLVDSIILRDPLVLETAIAVQFRELLVKPFCELRDNGQGVSMDAVIVVDGLDECKTTIAQSAIIELVTTSIHQQTTPFLWVFFSRPEPHIDEAFSSGLAIGVSWRMELPVSRDADSDVKAYLLDGFRVIRAKYRLPAETKWPSDDDIHCLVDQSSGLFVYPATIMRYIGQGTGAPEERLRLVLKLGWETVGPDNPLSALDRFYILIMEQIPKDVLPNTLSLLSIHLNWEGRRLDNPILYYCSILSLSLIAFRAATSNLHSVIDITESRGGMPWDFSFYHKSFVDFLSAVTRSGPEYCVNMRDNLRKCFDASVNFLYHNSATTDIEILAWSDPDGNINTAHWLALQILFAFAVCHELDLGKDILRLFSRINWKRLAVIRERSIKFVNVPAFIEKVPRYLRSTVIHSFGPLDTAQRTLLNMWWGKLRVGRKPNRKQVYVIGSGSKKALLVEVSNGYYDLWP